MDGAFELLLLEDLELVDGFDVLDANAFHVLRSPGIDVSVLLLDSLKGIIPEQRIVNKVSKIRKSYTYFQLSGNTGTTSVCELRRTEGKEGSVPGQDMMKIGLPLTISVV